MATKRVFTSSDKWDKAWFRKLSPRLKCLWAYITERCDQAGVWEADFELASFYIGEKVTEQDLSALEDRVIPFMKDKCRVIGYIYFQQNLANSEGCELNPRRLAHIPIIKLVNSYGFSPEIGKDNENDERKNEPILPFLVQRPEPPKPKKITKEQSVLKEDLFQEIFGNERYMESISRIADGKNIQEAFDECWTYHNLQPSPPTQSWVWKQKFLTWITNKRKDVTIKTKSQTRTKSLIDSFNERVGDAPEE